MFVRKNPLNVNKLYEDSKAYNKALADHQDMGKGFTDSVLYLPDYGIYDGMYGYISCSAIGLYLPIYLGATDENMSYGTAHMSNTSLPTGGENTHCVLVGHTGYFGRTFFDNIRNLEKGDALTIKTYFNTLTYEVVLYKEIGPTDTNDLFIQKEKDMLTLVTCSQWGSHLDNGVSIIAGPFFVCGETLDDFRSLTDEETQKYLERFSEPEDISRAEVEADMGFTFYSW